MANFDFITHDDLRSSLESDYQELQAAIAAQAYKAVHVLAGSIVEAVLVEHLLVIDYKAKANKDPLTMSLEKLIEACREEHVISQRIADLSTVIRSYRNLIHPARMVRLNDKADANGAKVAQALVEMIVDEVAERRKSTYGYTAAQVIEKLRKDPSVEAILEDLLKQTNSTELEKLLFAIPEIDINELEEDPEYIIEYARRVEECFYLTFNMVSDDSKTKVCKKFVRLIRDGSEREINVYGNSFFEANYLRYLPNQERHLAKKHILHRLPSIFFEHSRLLNGIGSFVTTEEAKIFTDAAIKALTSRHGRDDAYTVLEREYQGMSADVQEAVLRRIDDWISHYKGKSSEGLANRIDGIKQQLAQLDEEIPF